MEALYNSRIQIGFLPVPSGVAQNGGFQNNTSLDKDDKICIYSLLYNSSDLDSD